MALERRLATLIGVVESGLFIALASEVIVGSANGVKVAQGVTNCPTSIQVMGRMDSLAPRPLSTQQSWML